MTTPSQEGLFPEPPGMKTCLYEFCSVKFYPNPSKKDHGYHSQECRDRASILRRADQIRRTAPCVGAGEPKTPGRVLARRRAIKTLGRAHQRILTLLGSWQGHGRTDLEIQRDLGMNPNTERPRRGELVKLGKVKAQTGPGGVAEREEHTVWVLTEFVREGK